MEIENRVEGSVSGERAFRLKTEYSDRLADAIKATEATDQERDMALALVEQIERQVAENLHVWESQENPGVKVVHTRVSVLDIVTELGTGQQKELARRALDSKENGELKQRELVVFSSTPLEPVTPLEIFGADASPMTAMDISYEHVIKNVGSVMRKIEKGDYEDFILVAIGSPMPPGGRITKEFLDRIKEENFYWAEADLDAEFIEQELEDPNKRLTLMGHSHGATLAQMTAVRLEQRNPNEDWGGDVNYSVEVEGSGGVRTTKDVSETRARLRVLADDPTVSHGGEEDSEKKGRKIVLGAVKAGLSEAWTRRKDILAKLKYITKAYKKALVERGIEVDENENQKQLKKEAFKEIKQDLIEGPRRSVGERLKPQKTRVFERQGLDDETLDATEQARIASAWQEFNEKGLSESLAPLERENGVRKYGYRGRHAIDRFRHPKRIIKAARILMGGNN